MHVLLQSAQNVRFDDVTRLGRVFHISSHLVALLIIVQRMTIVGCQPSAVFVTYGLHSLWPLRCVRGPVLAALIAVYLKPGGPLVELLGA